MVRYECCACDMTATLVDNGLAETAWRDHLRSHGRVVGYNVWRWTVVPLPY